jgi:aldehyde:ferredoxin oxidoreductase
MALEGITGKVAWVDLSNLEVRIEKPDEEIYLKYLGGYGLGAYYLYRHQPAKIDPLGPEAILGFTTGPLTGTDAICGNRFAVVGKSPKTGGWGDANCGGKWGPALKRAGLDAVFFKGIAEKPTYALIENGKVTLHDASDYWGLGCGEAEEKFKKSYGNNAHSAVIGPAGERVSALACVINDAGRAAGRSGLGMVMGAKRLKGVVAKGAGEVPVAEPNKLKALRKELINKHYRDDNPLYSSFSKFGTAGYLVVGVASGDAPIKNWGGTMADYTNYEEISEEPFQPFHEKRYGCWKCPISCGAHVKIKSGEYAKQGHRPEYETMAAFGSMCLNDNMPSIVHLNNICNEAGMDTISTGATVAFAIECYENEIISKEDTGGIELTWGNTEGIVKVTEQMATGEGFGGKVLGDGIKKAVERLGESAEAFAIECGGEELPMHDPKYSPGYAAGYVVDATPARHTQWSSAYVEEGVTRELNVPEIVDKYNYSGKGEAHRMAHTYGHVVNAAGVCNFASYITPATAMPKYLTFALGREFDMDDILTIGERIANLRIAFNLREGIQNKEMYTLPDRVLGKPPLKQGPVEGIMVDNKTQVREYYEAMGWDLNSGVPKRAVFERLGLDFALDVTE